MRFVHYAQASETRRVATSTRAINRQCVSHPSTSVSNVRSYIRAIIHRNCDGDTRVVRYVVRKENGRGKRNGASRTRIFRLRDSPSPPKHFLQQRVSLLLRTWSEWPVQKTAQRNGIFHILDITPQKPTKPTIRQIFRNSIICSARLLFIFSRCFISSCMLHVYLCARARCVT